MEVRVEIFAIGNELCYGRVYDTNSFWIAAQATQLGAIVHRITCVPDVVEEICAALNDALTRKPDFVISTGGLGPTSDDLTVESLSKLIGVAIVTRKETLRSMAERRAVPVNDLPSNLVRMARSLKGAECLPNPLGWAPVTLIEKGDTTIAALPGPPREMRACFTEYLAKRIHGKTHYRSIAKRVLVTMYESRVSPITDEIMRTMPGVYLKPLVGEYQREKGLPVDIIAFAENEGKCKVRIDETIEKLRELINENDGHLEIMG